MQITKSTGLLLTFIALAPWAYSYTEPVLFDGEWALNPKGQDTTSVLRFHKDGMVENVVTEVTGKYQFLDDDRIMIEFEDGLMIGQFDETEDGHVVKGLFYPPSQRIHLEFTEPNEEKRQTAKEFQTRMQESFSERQSANVSNAILSNLATIAAAAQMHMLLEGDSEVGIEELVGPGKLIQQIQTIHGEDYGELKVTFETRKLSVRDLDGKEHSYEF